MSPDVFWGRSPTELRWWIEAKTPVRMYGAMTEDEVREIYEETYGSNGPDRRA
jgi:hypothetical protein